MAKADNKTVEKYIAAFPDEVQNRLEKLRQIIKKAAPDAEEEISYAMPAYKLYGRPLVYFAAFKNHIGFYATPTGHSEFAEELSKYKQGKGSVQFPMDKPLPLDLIRKMTEYRVTENLKRKTK